MSWMGPAAKKALKYGPHAQQIWKHVGKPAQATARKQWAVWAARRTAVQHADTLADGSVLGVMHDGERYWVVFSADEHVAVYPPTKTPISELVARADLGKRFTPAEVRERQLARELRQAAQERAKKLRPRRRRKEIE
jgi:hypothetical protein